LKSKGGGAERAERDEFLSAGLKAVTMRYPRDKNVMEGCIERYATETTVFGRELNDIGQ
jgi:hypothetical protein